MVININACIGCYNCVIACKDEHVGNEWLPYSVAQPDTGHFWMNLIEKERILPQVVRVTYTPTPCMQCRDAPCVRAAKGGGAYVRSDGIVVFDPEKAREQRQIVDSCPYGVVYWGQQKDVPGDAGLPQKCTFCAHLLDRGYRQPRCAESCPTNAIAFGDLDDPDSEVSKLIGSGVTETLRPELGIETAVRYIGLPNPVISGSVVFGDTGECGTDVKIAVFDDSGQRIETKTNNYGDFLVEGLPPGGRYEIRLVHPGYSSQRVFTTLDGDANLGDIVLQRK
jgi:Fe-S-cluster-containing dehydrogenase component